MSRTNFITGLRGWNLVVVLAFGLVTVRHAVGQVVLSPSAAATNHTPTLAIPEKPAEPPMDSKALEEQSEKIRAACVDGRRRICGRVLQIVPEGLVVESGYTNLLRPELSRSWIARSNVSASRPADLVEVNTPGAICVGTILLSDAPKRPAVKLYDYVILEAYPAGHHDYAPVPNVKKTVRRFSAELVSAVRLNMKADGK